MRQHDIGDDEIRVIGKPSGDDHKKVVLRNVIRVCLAVLVLAALALWIVRRVTLVSHEESQFVYEAEGVLSGPVSTPESTLAPVPAPSPSPSVLCDTLYGNGQTLVRLMPVNAVPELMIDRPDTLDEKILLAAQAADIRRDNGEIVGAYVLAGKPVAWGLSKKGYAAIIDGQLSVGVADNSPLFEKATETGGYFFRQYPLVDNGEPIMNNPKNKAVRKALCQSGEDAFLVISQDPLTLNEFSTALAAAGIENAISLVGGSSNGFVRSSDGGISHLGLTPRMAYKYENYIIWRSR